MADNDDEDYLEEFIIGDDDEDNEDSQNEPPTPDSADQIQAPPPTQDEDVIDAEFEVVADALPTPAPAPAAPKAAQSAPVAKPTTQKTGRRPTRTPADPEETIDMADDNNRQGQKKGPKADMLLTFTFLPNGLRFYLTVSQGAKRVINAPISVSAGGDLLSTPGLTTDDEGKAEWDYTPAAGVPPGTEFTFEVLTPSGMVTKKKRPEAQSTGSTKVNPKFICEKVQLDPGKYRLHLSLMHPDTKEALEGEVRISYPKPFRFDDEEIQPQDVKYFLISRRGEVVIFEITAPGKHKIDGDIIGWPNEDADIEVEGPDDNGPVTTDSKTGTFWEILFNGFK